MDPNTEDDNRTIEQLAAEVGEYDKQAEEVRKKLHRRAVEEAIGSHKHGHISEVARRAGITSQYLRLLIEEAHPGWLDDAAEKRRQEKENKERTARKEGAKRRADKARRAGARRSTNAA